MYQTDPATRQHLIDVFMEYNAYLNLSAIRTSEDIYTKHIVDSLELNQLDILQPWLTCIDIGTGGGFPMLPLAMTNPNVRFVGLDARRKKINAVQAMIEKLWISNAATVWQRAEEHTQRYDIVTARGVTYAHDLFSLCRRVCKRTGTMVRYKQFTYEEDVDIRELCHAQQCTVHAHEYTLPLTEQKRVLYCINNF